VYGDIVEWDCEYSDGSGDASGNPVCDGSWWDVVDGDGVFSPMWDCVLEYELELRVEEYWGGPLGLDSTNPVRVAVGPCEALDAYDGGK
jgi:hypothetical protein